MNFTKMHGLGNDFIVLDGTAQAIELAPARVAALADRHFGIGFDQLLIVEPATDPVNDFRYRIFNADGGEVQNCGNGARCFVRYVRDRGLTDKRTIRVETAGGLLQLVERDDGLITVDMGAPRFVPADLPFQAEAEADRYPLEVDGEIVQIHALSMGNPHAVVEVDDIDTAPVQTLGPQIESHPRFPERVNAGFVQVVDQNNIRVRVFERGVGETLACGTGACAAMVAMRRAGKVDAEVTATVRGGALQLEWQGNGQPVLMTGPAETVFEGAIET